MRILSRTIVSDTNRGLTVLDIRPIWWPMDDINCGADLFMLDIGSRLLTGRNLASWLETLLLIRELLPHSFVFTAWIAVEEISVLERIT